MTETCAGYLVEAALIFLFVLLWWKERLRRIDAEALGERIGEQLKDLVKKIEAGDV